MRDGARSVRVRVLPWGCGRSARAAALEEAALFGTQGFAELHAFQDVGAAHRADGWVGAGRAVSLGSGRSAFGRAPVWLPAGCRWRHGFGGRRCRLLAGASADDADTGAVGPALRAAPARWRLRAAAGLDATGATGVAAGALQQPPGRQPLRWPGPGPAHKGQMARRGGSRGLAVRLRRDPGLRCRRGNGRGEACPVADRPRHCPPGRGCLPWPATAGVGR
jgi:hypothetical protein